MKKLFTLGLAGIVAGYSLFPIKQSEASRDFIRGDVTQDGKLDIADPIFLAGYLFQGRAEPQCLDAADVNDDGKLNLTDAVHALDYLFKGKTPPASPFPDLGKDESIDELTCFGDPDRPLEEIIELGQRDLQQGPFIISYQGDPSHWRVYRIIEPLQGESDGIILDKASFVRIEGGSIQYGIKRSGNGILAHDCHDIEIRDVLITKDKLGEEESEGDFNYGVAFTNTDHSIIQGVQVRQNIPYGVCVYFEKGSDDNTVRENTLEFDGFESAGLYWYLSNRNFALLNTIVSRGDGSPAAYIAYSTSPRLNENRFYTYGDGSPVIYLDNVGGGNLEDNLAESFGGRFLVEEDPLSYASSHSLLVYGEGNLGNVFLRDRMKTSGDDSSTVVLVDGDGSKFMNCEMVTRGENAYALRVNFPSNSRAEFRNCMFDTQNTNVPDLYFHDIARGKLSLINTPFDRVSFGDRNSSQLEVSWSLDALVQRGGAPLQGAGVEAYTLLGEKAFSEITGDQGRIPSQILPAYVQKRNMRIDYSPYTVRAAFGDFQEEKIVDLNQTRDVLFVLE